MRATAESAKKRATYVSSTVSSSVSNTVGLDTSAVSDIEINDMMKKYDRDGDGAYSAAEVRAMVTDLGQEKKGKALMAKLAGIVFTLFCLMLLGNAGLTAAVVFLSKETKISGSTMTAQGDDRVISTAEATAAVPLYVAPVLATETLGALRWMAAKHLDVVDEVIDATGSDAATGNGSSIVNGSSSVNVSSTGNVTNVQVVVLQPSPAQLLTEVRSVFHVSHIEVHSSTHIDIETLEGRTIEVKGGAATLVDKATSVQRSLCTANVTCASFRVDASLAAGLHEQALRALLQQGYEIDDDIRALPIVQALLSGKLAAEATEAQGRRRLKHVHPSFGHGRGLQVGIVPGTFPSTPTIPVEGPPNCNNQCGNNKAGDGICDDGGGCNYFLDGSTCFGSAAPECIVGSDCQDCGDRSHNGNWNLVVKTAMRKGFDNVRRMGQRGLPCKSYLGGSTAYTVPAESRFAPYYTCEVKNVDGAEWAEFFLADGFNLDSAPPYDGPRFAPRHIVMSYSASAFGFDGGTVIEDFCDPFAVGANPCAGGAMVGYCCRTRYNYADNRDLATINPGSLTIGLTSRTAFDITWRCYCFGSTGMPMSCTSKDDATRKCEIREAYAEYTVEASDAAQSSYDPGGEKREWTWSRSFDVKLETTGVTNLEDSKGSVTLPAFRACNKFCNCASFPKLMWDFVGQEWAEVPSADGQCSDQETQRMVEESCQGASFASRAVGSPHLMTKEERAVHLRAERFYQDYKDIAKFLAWGEVSTAELLEREGELWYTLAMWQRKFAPWVPDCAYPGTVRTFKEAVTDPAATRLNGVWDVGSTHSETTNFVEWSPPPSVTPAAVYFAGFGRQLTGVPITAAAECTWSNTNAITSPPSDRLLSDSEHERKLRGAGCATRGCAKYRNCATKTRRAPPRRP